jgi:hypothetical protein
MWVQVPGKFLELLKRNRVRPARVALRTPWVFMVMERLCRDLGIEIQPDPELRALRDARRNLERFRRQ